MDLKLIINRLKEFSQLPHGTSLKPAQKILLLKMAKYLDDNLLSREQEDSADDIRCFECGAPDGYRHRANCLYAGIFYR